LKNAAIFLASLELAPVGNLKSPVPKNITWTVERTRSTGISAKIGLEWGKRRIRQQVLLGEIDGF